MIVRKLSAADRSRCMPNPAARSSICSVVGVLTEIVMAFASLIAPARPPHAAPGEAMAQAPAPINGGPYAARKIAQRACRAGDVLP